MRKQFGTRARLAVYVEHADLERMTAKARSEGKLLAEWARETLLGELEDDSAVRREPRAVRVAERRPDTVELDVVAPEGPRGKATVERPTGPTCPHGKGRGYHCWQCGGLAVIP